MTASTRLTRGQAAVLIAAALLMAAVGGLGAWGTYTNIATEFGRAATAAGVVAAGEGVVLILALVMLGVTMLGQTAPAPVRAGLWLAPAAAAATGITVADTVREAVVYAITPMAMSAAAEGTAFIARRVVVYRTGADTEALRRNAAAVQRLAYHQARAANHPSSHARKRSERISWRLAKRIGIGDTELGADLIDVQRERLRHGADTALADMLTVSPTTPTAAPAPPRHSATEVLRRRFAEMDPADAIRIAHDAHPDMPPAELASLLIGYGVIVDAVQVALVLNGPPPHTTLDRDDNGDAHHDAPQVNELPRGFKAQAILDAAAALGPKPKAADIVDRVQRINRITVDAPYVRTVLSREAKKKTDPSDSSNPMEGGYA
ncbi:conjugal transfer protein [Streptomyces sp. CC228A]|uniref:conjugal transfer protein n=1 Tax=Streptomyces sp. CC228A TaxID=2898186 RepID=UPI001F43C0A6|nr:conjugal transfer protein [Streptomyces sp. CC228A]